MVQFVNTEDVSINGKNNKKRKEILLISSEYL